MRVGPPSRVRPRASSRPPLPPAPACDALCVSPGVRAVSRAGVASTFHATHSSGTVSRTHFFCLWAWVPPHESSLQCPSLLPYCSGCVQLVFADPQGNSGPRAMPGEDLGVFIHPPACPASGIPAASLAPSPRV